MKAVCPNGCSPKRFITTAHVCEDWVVDEDGNFMSYPENTDSCVVSDPDPANTWTCVSCGSSATFDDGGAE